MLEATERRLHAEFAEVVCADSAWVREEFAAIVAANFSRIPPRDTTPPQRQGPAFGSRGRRPASTSPLMPRSSGPTAVARHWSWARSPPCSARDLAS